MLVGCSDNSSSSKGTGSATGASPTSATVASGGKTSVKVDGSDLQGLDLNSVTCVKQGGTINIASGAVGGPEQFGDGRHCRVPVGGIDDDVEHLVPAVECLQQGFGDFTAGGGTIQIGHAAKPRSSAACAGIGSGDQDQT